jgi:hypothetical protein
MRPWPFRFPGVHAKTGPRGRIADTTGASEERKLVSRKRADQLED